jgi:hypothetical protein
MFDALNTGTLHVYNGLALQSHNFESSEPRNPRTFQVYNPLTL